MVTVIAVVGTLVWVASALQKIRAPRTTALKLVGLGVPTRAASRLVYPLSAIDGAAAFAWILSPVLATYVSLSLLAAYSTATTGGACDCLAGPSWVNAHPSAETPFLPRSSSCPP
jgi:hypothetical protein